MGKNCLNCNQIINDKYCGNCGQKGSAHRYSIKHFIEHDLIHGIWHVDNGIVFTIKELFTRPGHSIREFISGKRMGYFSFVTLLLLIVGVSHFLQEYAQVKLSDLMPASSKKMMNEFQEFTKNNPKAILIMTIPIYSLFSFLWFRKSKLNLTENLVLNSYKTVGELLIGLLFVLITIFYTNIKVLIIIYNIILLSSMVYSFWFYRQFFSAFGYSKKSVILRSLGVIFSYVFLSFLVGIVIGVMNLLKR